jgi:hypothetical protein
MNQEQEEVILSKLSIHDTFSFQLVGFSMTAHKAQGRTMGKVALDLHYKSNSRKRNDISLLKERQKFHQFPAVFCGCFCSADPPQLCQWFSLKPCVES